MRILAIAAVASLLMAGCAGNEPETPMDATTPPADDEAADGNVTLELGNVSLPKAMLGVETVNGTAPLLVNFTVDATNATAWTLDFGDGNVTNGTQFPAAVNHTFGVGLFNVSLAAFGDNATAWHNATINVTGQLVSLLPLWEQSVTLDAPCEACHADSTDGCVWRQASVSPVKDCHWLDFPDEYAGIGVYTLSASDGDPGLRFYSSCGSGTVSGAITNAGTESGKIPAGAVCALIWQGGESGSSTLTFTAEQLE